MLSLPAGASAISPEVCVNSTYPIARTMIRTVSGASALSFKVSYSSQPGFANAGALHGRRNTWTLSNPLELRTAGLIGWQLGQFEFVAGGKRGDVQLYNFYLDPYSSVLHTSSLA